MSQSAWAITAWCSMTMTDLPEANPVQESAGVRPQPFRNPRCYLKPASGEDTLLSQRTHQFVILPVQRLIARLDLPRLCGDRLESRQ